MNITKLARDIDEIFKPIVGQSMAKARIKQWALGSAASDGYLKPICLFGGPGYGKSKFIKAIIDILKISSPKKVGNMHFCEKGSECGTMTSFIEGMVINYLHDRDFLIAIDEFHEVNKNTMGFIRSMISPDIHRSSVIIKSDLSPSGEIIINPCKGTFVFATNLAQKVDPALMTRVIPIYLQEYTDEEMGEILCNGVEANGLRFNEDSILPLAKTCRGTARDVGDIVNDIVGLVAVKGKKTVSQDDVRELIKLRGCYMEGLNHLELSILLHLEESGGLQLRQLACRHGMQSKELQTAEVIPFKRGFLTVDTLRRLTAKGHSYLAELRKHRMIPQRPTKTVVA